MLVYTDKLEGIALNWAVASALGHKPVFNMKSHNHLWHSWWLSNTSRYEKLPDYVNTWEIAGAIIEYEKICLDYWQGVWSARIYDDPTAKIKGEYKQTGPTPLIAAMRCYVTSKAGYQVEITDEIYYAK